ncbi:MAG: three-Cys-motif partner protein TcmP [Solirubrobacteraceae bacterium]
MTWKREDHTAAKHDLLRAFFVKWVSIHSGYFTQRRGGLVRIYDGFAGPGVYAGGEPGSPRILLEELLDNPNLLGRWVAVRYEFTFVEQDARRARMLDGILSEIERARRAAGAWTDQIRWSVTHGRYEEHVPQPVAERNSALFLFLDPFGYSHAPMTLTTRLVQQPKSDTLIFLPLSFVHRFADREGQDEALDRFFGTSVWRDVSNGPHRPQALLELFQRQLRAAGLNHTLPFCLKPPDRRNEYWIVGASSHPRGFASIKEGYWAVDPIDGYGFAAPKPAGAGQGALFGELPPADPDTAPLLAEIRARFGNDWFTVEDAIALTERSRFLDSHLKERTLAPAEKNGMLEVDRSGGGVRFKEGRGTKMRFR